MRVYIIPLLLRLPRKAGSERAESVAELTAASMDLTCWSLEGGQQREGGREREREEEIEILKLAYGFAKTVKHVW